MNNQIVLPNTGIYPIKPRELALEQELNIFHDYLVDLYLTHLVQYAVDADTFIIDKDAFHQWCKNNIEGPFSIHSSENWNRELSESHCGNVYLWVTEQTIFLTHRLIAKVMQFRPHNIGLEHIDFDEVPRKTELERFKPERFFQLKEMVTLAKSTGSLGPFNKNKFSECVGLTSFLDDREDGLYIKKTLLMYLFQYYPRIDFVSVENSI